MYEKIKLRAEDPLKINKSLICEKISHKITAKNKAKFTQMIFFKIRT